MHLNCLQENLSHGLGIVQRAVATRTTLPITQHVLLATDEGRLKLSATNLEIAISTWVGGEIQEEGAVTVPARLLTDFVNSLPRQPIEVKTIENGKGVEVRGERVEGKINGSDANEFPPIPSVSDGVAASIAPKALREAIHQVVLAAAAEDSRPVLTGVNVELEGGQLTLAAADGFRLAVHRTQIVQPVNEKLSVIVPARTLQEIERIIEGDEPIEIMVTPQRSQILFKLKNIEVVSQLIQGTFPNYSQLIPQDHSTRIVVDLGDLQRATRTASIFAKDGSGIIRIQAGKAAGDGRGKLTISSRAEELGDNTGDLDVDIDGDEARIAFSSKYLNDVLSVIGGEEVVLDMTTSSSPGVIRPVQGAKKWRDRSDDEKAPDERYVHVVMPMFVQW